MAGSTIADFRKYRESEKKEIILPVSKLVVVIKKLTGRDYIKSGILEIEGIEQYSKTSEEKMSILVEKMSKKDKELAYKANDSMIVMGVVEPAMKMEGDPDPEKIGVDELVGDDYKELFEAIITYSKGRQDLKPFREEQPISNSGLDSEQIQSVAVADNETVN